MTADAKAGFCSSCRGGDHALCASPACVCAAQWHRGPELLAETCHRMCPLDADRALCGANVAGQELCFGDCPHEDCPTCEGLKGVRCLHCEPVA